MHSAVAGCPVAAFEGALRRKVEGIKSRIYIVEGIAILANKHLEA